MNVSLWLSEGENITQLSCSTMHHNSTGSSLIREDPDLFYQGTVQNWFEVDHSIPNVPIILNRIGLYLYHWLSVSQYFIDILIKRTMNITNAHS